MNTRRALPRDVWALGIVSLFMDTSSELVHSLLPVFLATTLGASMATIGTMEGAAEAAASFAKVFSGTISDQLRKRKSLLVLGYGLSALTKPVFALASSTGAVFGARVSDRVGKGIRGAPRDALVADVTPMELRGAAYGLRQTLDTVGSFVGPSLALLFMLWFRNDVRSVFWVAVVPAVAAVLILIVTVREPSQHVLAPRNHLTWADARRLGPGFWLVIGLGAVFTLARFSEAFLVLRARDVGVAIGRVPAILIVMNVVYSVFAYPAGAAADKVAARSLLAFGLGVLVVADIVLALARSPWTVFSGAALWGLHMAFTQGLLTKLVADVTPSDLRGTGFGVFNLVSGGALLLASVIAGSLWSAFGPSATFFAGAAFAVVATAGLLLYRPRDLNVA